MKSERQSECVLDSFQIYVPPDECVVKGQSCQNVPEPSEES